MEHVIRKILIPAELFGKLNTDNLTHLDKSMHDILFGNEKNDDVKWKLYSQALQSYLSKIRTSEEPVEIPVISTCPEETSLVADSKAILTDRLLTDLGAVIPKRFIQKAKTLYVLLNQGDIVKWDSDGVVSIDNQIILGSNILELIKNAVVSKRNFKPVGWSKFATAIQDADVPQGILGEKFIAEELETPRKLRRLNYNDYKESKGPKVKWQRCRL